MGATLWHGWMMNQIKKKTKKEKNVSKLDITGKKPESDLVWVTRA